MDKQVKMQWSYSLKLFSGLVIVCGFYYLLKDCLPYMQNRPNGFVPLEQLLPDQATFLLTWLRINVPFLDWALMFVVSAVAMLVIRRRLAKLLKGTLESSEPEPGKVFVLNKMTPEEFNDLTATRKAVMELYNSPEYQNLKAKRGNNMREWNWQCRQQDDEETDDDLLSDSDSCN